MSKNIASRNVKILVRKKSYTPYWWVLPLIIAAIIFALASAFWARPNFNGDTAKDAIATLKAKGIDTTGLKIESNYRDLTISGIAAAGVSALAIKEALSFEGKGEWNNPIYDIKFDLKEAAPVKAAPVKTGPTDVIAKVTEDKIVLTGEVLTQKQKDIIYESAVKRYGKDNVTNNITVSKLVEATKDADGRALALATIIAGIPMGVVGKGTLSDTKLTFEGVANSAKDKPAYQKIFDGVKGIESSMTMKVPEVAKEIDTLDEEFTALSAEIERRVVFKTASAVLRSTARSTLNKAVVLMNKYKLPVVAIVGHTDDRGDDVKNQQLSERRAQAVVKYLIKKGIKTDRLSARGAGESEPRTTNDTAEGRQKNRRVVFTAKRKF